MTSVTSKLIGDEKPQSNGHPNAAAARRQPFRPLLFLFLMLVVCEVAARFYFTPEKLHTERLEAHYSIGRLNLLANSMRQSKSPTIALIGDSIAVGHTARSGHDIRAACESQLQAALPKAQVWNFAVSGNGGGDVYLIAHRIIQSHPSLILCEINVRWLNEETRVLGHTDMIEPFVHKPLRFYDAEIAETKQAAVERWLTIFMETHFFLIGCRHDFANPFETIDSYASQWTNYGMFRYGVPKPISDRHKWMQDRWNFPTPAANLPNLTAMGKIAQEAQINHIPVIFFIPPPDHSRPEIKDALNSSSFRNKISLIKTTVDFPNCITLDLTRALPPDKSYFDRTVWGKWDDVHLSEKGMSALAQYITPSIINQLKRPKR